MCDDFDFDNWNPMKEDFQSVVFNSYISGQTAANLPYNMLSTFGTETKRKPKLYIDGFPSELTERGLRNLLERIGCQPLSVKIVDNKNRFGRHFGFVDFDSLKEAQKAIELIRRQSIYKLSVGFSTTETDRQLRDNAIEKERRDFEQLFLQQRNMKPKIDIGNNSALNAKSNGHSEAICDQSDSSSHDSLLLDQVLTPLAKTDKLLKILERPDDNCSFCSDKQNLEHLHFILSEQQILDPLKMPELMEMLNTCIACERKGSDLRLCSQCKSAIYCNVKCQSSHWPRHRNDCKRESRLNSTLNLNKTLNSFNESIETNVEPIKTNVTQNITENQTNIVRPNITKTTPQILSTIRSIPKESTPLAVLRQNCGDNKVPAVPKASQVSQPSGDTIVEESNGSFDAVDGIPRSNIKEKTIPIKEKTIPIKDNIETELLTDGEDELVVCFGRNPFDFYLQKSSNTEEIDRFTEEINNKVKEFPVLSDEELRIGTLCGGIYSEDNVCYRARIDNKINEKTYALLFIDYGNMEPVDNKDIRRIPNNYFNSKAQAIHCSLYDLIPNDNIWSKEAIDLLGTVGENNEYTKVKIFEKTNEDIYKIDLFNKNGESLRQLFVDKNYAKYSPNMSAIKSPNKTPEKSMESIISAIGSPKVTFNKASVNEIDGNFSQRMSALEENSDIKLTSYFNEIDLNSKLRLFLSVVFNEEEMQYFASVFHRDVEDLMESLKVTPKERISPQVGDIVVAKASDDDFYRTYVLNVEQKSCELCMIDAGFIETVKFESIYKLDPKLKEFPVYGVLLLPNTKSGVALIERLKSDEGQTIEGTFFRQNDKLLIRSEDISIQFLDFESIIEFLKLWPQKKVNTEVTEEVPNIAPKPLPELSLPLDQSLEVMALYQEPDDYKTIYVTAEVELFQQMMGLCQGFGVKFNDSVRVEPKVGFVYAVRSSDNEWYRAVVTEVKADKINVRYIDFGNEEEVDSKFVGKLTEQMDVSTISPLAVKCKVESKLKEQDLRAKIEQCLNGAFLLKVKTTKFEDSINYVKVK